MAKAQNNYRPISVTANTTDDEIRTSAGQLAYEYAMQVEKRCANQEAIFSDVVQILERRIEVLEGRKK